MPVRILSNAELDKAQQMAIEGTDDPTEVEVLVGLAAHIHKCWEAARTQKQSVRERIHKAQRARRGEYDPVKLQAIRSVGGSEEYGRVTSNKCRIAESWLQDVYFGQSERSWTIKPTPVPTLPPEDIAKVETTIQQEIMEAVGTFAEAPGQDMIQSRRNELTDAVRMRLREEAMLATERMEAEMDDQLTEANWRDEWSDFLNDFATYPAAHFKGPIIRRRSQLKWVQKNGKWTTKATEELVPDFERVDPIRCYPSPGAVTPQDKYFIEHISLAHGELYDLIGVPGFSEESIRAALEDGSSGMLSNWLGLTDADQMDHEANDVTYLTPDHDYDVLEFHGPATGKDLLEWGMDADEIDDPQREYDVCAWLVGGHVIKAVLNYSPLGLRPYYKACWEEVPGEYWGQSLPDSLEDVQGVVNASIRSLVNNMGIASGPQVMANVDRLPPGEEIEGMEPWKIWQIHDSQTGSTAPAIEFYQPSANSAEILNVLERFYTFADDWSLIPRYMQGSSDISGGVGRTASGMSMLFNAANKGLKGVVATIDKKVLAPMLQQLYAFNMEYNDDQSVKGDAQIEARGAVSLMQLETLQMRRNEFLQATANEIDSQIVGPEGRAEILREIAKGLDMDVSRVVPRRGEVPPMPTAGTEGQQAQVGNGQALANGAAVTDNFNPTSMTPAV